METTRVKIFRTFVLLSLKLCCLFRIPINSWIFYSDRWDEKREPWICFTSPESLVYFMLPVHLKIFKVLQVLLLNKELIIYYIGHFNGCWFLDQPLGPSTSGRETPFKGLLGNQCWPFWKRTWRNLKIYVMKPVCFLWNSVSSPTSSVVLMWGLTVQGWGLVPKWMVRGNPLTLTLTPYTSQLHSVSPNTQMIHVLTVDLKCMSTSQIPKMLYHSKMPLHVFSFQASKWSNALPSVSEWVHWYCSLIPWYLSSESFYFELNLVLPPEVWGLLLDTADVSVPWSVIIKIIIRSICPD